MKKRITQGKKLPISQAFKLKIEQIVEEKIAAWKKKASPLKKESITIQSEGYCKEPVHLFNFRRRR